MWAAILPIVLLLAAASTAHAQRTLYVSADWPSAGLHTLAVNLNTGELTEVPGSPTAAGSTPVVPTVSPNADLLYVPDYWGDELHGYSLDPLTGLPTQLASSPTPTAANPNAAVFKPDGSAVFVANYGAGSIGSWQVDGSGALTEAPGAPFAASGSPTSLATTPVAPHVYAPAFSGDSIDGFTFGSGPAELNPISGFPLPVPGAAPVDVEYSVDGSLLFTLNQGTDDIASFSVNKANGALTPVGTPPTLGGVPNALAASPNGEWLAAVDQSNNLTMFSIAASGQLTQIGLPVSIGGNYPSDIVFTPDSHFAYTSNFYSSDVSGFEIDQSSGAAAALSGSPFDFGNGAMFSLAVSPDQGPQAAFDTAISGSTASFDGSASSDDDGSVARYSWNFGDGNSDTTTTPTTSHAYADNGTYVTTLTVADNENCSNEQIGTGQTINCNGSSAAQASANVAIDVPAPNPPAPPVTPSNPLILSNVSVQQLRLRKGETRRRVISRYSLNRKAGMTIQFQKVNSGRVVNGKCQYTSRANSSKRKCAHVRNYGKPVKLRGNPGTNRKTFVRTFGGKPITRGRFRQVIYAADGVSTKSRTLLYGFRVQGP